MYEREDWIVLLSLNDVGYIIALHNRINKKYAAHV
jgi:hypothetical protein